MSHQWARPSHKLSLLNIHVSEPYQCFIFTHITHISTSFHTDCTLFLYAHLKFCLVTHHHYHHYHHHHNDDDDDDNDSDDKNNNIDGDCDDDDNNNNNDNNSNNDNDTERPNARFL